MGRERAFSLAARTAAYDPKQPSNFLDSQPVSGPLSTASCVGCKSTCSANTVFGNPAEVRVSGSCYLQLRFLFKQPVLSSPCYSIHFK